MTTHRKIRTSRWTARKGALAFAATAAGLVAVPGVANAAEAPAGSAHIDAAAPVAKVTAVQTSAQVAAAATAVANAVTPTAATSAAAKTYTVKSGDTLFNIAAATLGDGFRYTEIFDLNSGKSEADGSKFVNADLIQPGWTLDLPTGAKAAASTSSSGTSSSSSSSSKSSWTSSSSSSSTSKATTTASSASSASTGTYANNLDGWIKEAQAVLSANGYSVSYNAIYQTAMHESAGNPSATNGWDSNAANGTPSIGLMQTIQPTFNAYALSGHTNIYNPVDNIIAAARYAAAVYGSLDNVVAARGGGSNWYGY